jgi:putative glutamine amidotransferase
MTVVVGLTPDVDLPTEAEPVGRYHLKTAYVAAVTRAGGLPLVLPYTDDPVAVSVYLDRLDALVVTGGAFDVAAELYGEVSGPAMGTLKPQRTAFELALLRGALERGLPVLGVCGGMQLLNVVYGGTLVQDIGTEMPEAGPHEQDHDRREPAHDVVVTPGTHLAACVLESVPSAEGAELPRLPVNSTHHQAVRDPGAGLRISGRAPDEVIEAIEDPARPFVVGVQWHPEMLAPAHRAHQALYDALVRAGGSRG